MLNVGLLVSLQAHPCAIDVCMPCTQGALCSRFSVGHYPSLRFGKPANFGIGKEAQLEEYNGVRAEKEIIEWIGKLQSA